MAGRELRRLLRGAQKSAVLDAIALFGRPVRIEDTQGTTLIGQDGLPGERHPIQVDGEELGILIGPEDAGTLVRVVTHLAARELEKRALANETLDRYKELTLLYDMSDQLSKLLDLDEVARHVVEQADRHLKADAAALFLCQPGAETLRVQAVLGHDDGEAEAGDVVERVFSTGRSELVSLDGKLVLAAPLRHGEQVFGVLRACRDGGSEEWTAGDLKLVTAVASNAASALRKAQLHARQVRELALRHQVQRHVSADLLEAVFDGMAVEEAELAVLFCDLRAISHADTGETPSDLLQGVEAALAEALHLLMMRGAVVDLPLGEMLVAVFWAPEGLAGAAPRAVAAATELVAILAPRGGIGVGVASGPVHAHRGTEALHAVVHAAAQLHEEAIEGVLVDAGVRDAADAAFPFTPWTRGNRTSAFEVTAP